MSSSDVGSASSSGGGRNCSTIEMALEVVTLPCLRYRSSEAKTSIKAWDGGSEIDLVVGDDIRTVQFTPPHSQCSIQFGKGTTAEPGSAQGLILVAVNPRCTGRDFVGSRGVEVSEVAVQRPPGFEASEAAPYFALGVFQRPGSTAGHQ